MNATSAPCCDDDDEDEEGEAADMEGIPSFLLKSHILVSLRSSPVPLLVVLEYEESGLLETDEV